MMAEGRHRSRDGKTRRKALFWGLALTSPVWLALPLFFGFRLLVLPLSAFHHCYSAGGFIVRAAILLVATVIAQAFVLHRLELEVRWGKALVLCVVGTAIGLWLGLSVLFGTAEELTNVAGNRAVLVLKVLGAMVLANAVLVSIFGVSLADRSGRESSRNSSAIPDSVEGDAGTSGTSLPGRGRSLLRIDSAKFATELVISPSVPWSSSQPDTWARASQRCCLPSYHGH